MVPPVDALRATLQRLEERGPRVPGVQEMELIVVTGGAPTALTLTPPPLPVTVIASPAGEAPKLLLMLIGAALPPDKVTETCGNYSIRNGSGIQSPRDARDCACTAGAGYRLAHRRQRGPGSYVQACHARGGIGERPLNGRRLVGARRGERKTERSGAARKYRARGEG